MMLNRLRDEVFANAKAHGWHDEPIPIPQAVALLHCEVSEALIEFRNGHGPAEVYYDPDKPGKPEGVPVEIADIMIRCLDFCGEHGIDIDAVMAEKMRYNVTRPRRHGGKVV